MEYHGASWVSGSSDGDSLADSTILHPSSLANTRSEGCFKQTKPHMAALSASGFAPRVGSEQQLKAPRPQPIRRSSSDLFECIDSFKNGMPEPQARHIFAQIVSVVASLDRQNIYHLDLKDENVVVDANFDVRLDLPFHFL